MPQTLQCPKCSKAVSVGDQSAGKRVKCPHCSKEFLAPGFAKSSNDDDDWLQLDNDPPKTPLQSPAVKKRPVANPKSPDTSVKPSTAQISNSTSDDEVVDVVELVDDDDLLGSLAPSKTSPKTAAKKTGNRNPSSPKRPPTAPVSGGSDDPLGTLADELPSLEDVEIGDLEPLPPRVSGAAAAAGLDMFGATLDEFTSSVEPLPSKAPAKSDDVFGDLPPVDPSEVPNAGPVDEVIPTVEAVEYQQEFRINCHICGSLLYAKAKQEGRKIKCHDCHSEILVPAPPRVKKKPKVNIEGAATFSFEESAATSNKNRAADPYRKSAQDLLEEASKVETFEDKSDFDAPDMKEWALNTFGVFLDPGVILHWGGISLAASIPTAIVLWTEVSLLLVGLFVGGLILAAVVASCGLAILQAVANKHKTVSEWPTGNPIAWFDDLIVVLAAAGLVGIPVWALTMFVFGAHLISVAVTMFAIYALFPFVLLSMMDMRSIFVPFSPEVARSVSRCQEAWGGLYFSAGLVFVGLFIFFASLVGAGSPIVTAVGGITASVAVAFCYFAMIGRLAYTIGQTVNEPPKKRTAAAEE